MALKIPFFVWMKSLKVNNKCRNRIGDFQINDPSESMDSFIASAETLHISVLLTYSMLHNTLEKLGFSKMTKEILQFPHFFKKFSLTKSNLTSRTRVLKVFFIIWHAILTTTFEDLMCTSSKWSVSSMSQKTHDSTILFFNS